MLICRSNGQRRLGSPLKKLLGEAETGLSRPNSWRMMMMMMMTISEAIQTNKGVRQWCCFSPSYSKCTLYFTGIHNGDK